MKKTMVKKKSFVNLVEDPHFLYYEGFEIQVLPGHKKGSAGWTSDICLYRHQGKQIKQRTFVNATPYKSKSEAVKQGFKFGQGIIDGKINKYSVKNI